MILQQKGRRSTVFRDGLERNEAPAPRRAGLGPERGEEGENANVTFLRIA